MRNLRKQWRRPGDRGMVTSEYAVGTLTAVAFAGVLAVMVKSDAVSSALRSMLMRALHGSF